MADYAARRKRRGEKRPISAGALLLTALLLAMAATVALAMYVRTTGERRNSLTPAAVSCAVAESVTTSGSQSVKTSITVKNTSTTAVYIRARLVSYWQTPSGLAAARTAPVLTVTPGNGWISAGDDTYYYKQPVEPGASTGNLLDGDMTLIVDDEGYIQVVEVLAEAIQAAPAKAAAEAWDITVGADGVITEVAP